MNNDTRLVVTADGTKQWWRNDERHREDGPAIEHADGRKYWYRNGELHREDGPAMDTPPTAKEHRNG